MTTATVTMPARKASAINLRGSVCGASSRRQNQSHASAGKTPPATAPSMGSSSGIVRIVAWPRGYHQEFGVFLWKLLPYRLGDEWHERVQQFQRYRKNFMQGGGAAGARRRISALQC